MSLWTSTVLYNVILLVVEIFTILKIQQDRRTNRTLFSCVATFLAAILLAFCLGRPRIYRVLRLMAFGLFGHLGIFLVAAALMTRKRSRWVAGGMIVSACLIAAAAVDAFWIEPTALQVRHFELTSAKLTRPVKIVVVADLQTDFVGEYERRAMQKVMELAPDLIVFAGDYCQARTPQGNIDVCRDLNRLFAEVKLVAPLGIVAVGGNVDPPEWVDAFEGIESHLFTMTESIKLGELGVTGLQTEDSAFSHLRVSPHSDFHIVVGHHPDYALGQIDADLLIAGHTHGGQVRIPGFGPLLTATSVPRDWTEGLTQLSANRTLIVSKGIGLERLDAPRMRLFCRPEIVVIDLLPESSREYPAENPASQ